ncbi:MAG: hypothetical protein IJT53_02050 [Prevotella sp.]|nr:hypothetical protein [Prevotella sp.]
MKRLFIVVALMIAALGVQAQASKYIVKTKGAKKTVVASQTAESDAPKEEEKAQDFLSQYFRYVSLCDWKEGMRFMVIPDKKDLVIKTFADAATGQMVSSTKLRHKIMVYKGHENTGGLHEHINFVCEDDGKAYYFEVPSATFDDYCFGKLGVPTLAYLGDVDTAIEVLKDKTLFTMADEYYVDTEVDGDGYTAIFDVKEGTEVKVVAVGVGTRSFPVKIIVADESGREFYQNVAISRTNSGMRDDEFDISNMRIHSFKGAFELPADNMAVSSAYKKYIGQEVFTLYSTTMQDASGKTTKVARLSTFKIRDIRVQRGTHYVKMTLQGMGTGKTYTKEVTFVSHDVSGDIDGTREDLFTKLFASGNPLKMEGVQKAHLADIQKSIVRKGYSENEVKLALGEPSGRGEESAFYTWVYKNPGQPYACVFFNKKTKRVASIKK